MARAREDERLIQAALQEAASKQQLTEAQVERMRQEGVEAQQKLELAAREIADKMQLGQAELTTKEKLGGEEVSQRDRAARIAAAANFYQLDQTLQSENLKGRYNLLSDLAKAGRIDENVLADAMKAGGDPTLANALDVARREKADTAVRQFAPLLTSPKIRSEEEREKKFRPLIEAQVGKGGYERALALAYPKEGQAPPELPGRPGVASVAGAPTERSQLVNTLLKLSGVEPSTGTADVAGATERVAPPPPIPTQGQRFTPGTAVPYTSPVRTPPPSFVDPATGLRTAYLPSGGTATFYDRSTPQGRAAIGAPKETAERMMTTDYRAEPSGRFTEQLNIPAPAVRAPITPEFRYDQDVGWVPRAVPINAPQRTPLVPDLTQARPPEGNVDQFGYRRTVERTPVEQLLTAAQPSGLPTPTPTPPPRPIAPTVSEEEEARQAERRRMLEEEMRRRMAAQRGE